MASADLRQELVCSICLSIYTDPVTLRCGHNFCRVCIDRVLDTQEGSGAYTCPECRAECAERPALQRNITLCNVVEILTSTQQGQEETVIFCTYCVDSPVPAAKSCLLCEAHLCDRHLRVHSKSADHVLSDPTAALGNRKCFVHNRILEYYCTEDAACICLLCRLDGEHQGHKVEVLEETYKKEKLIDVLQKLSRKRAETEEKVWSLQNRRREDQEKAAGVGWSGLPPKAVDTRAPEQAFSSHGNGASGATQTSSAGSSSVVFGNVSQPSTQPSSSSVFGSAVPSNSTSGGFGSAALVCSSAPSDNIPPSPASVPAPSNTVFNSSASLSAPTGSSIVFGRPTSLSSPSDSSVAFVISSMSSNPTSPNNVFGTAAPVSTSSSSNVFGSGAHTSSSASSNSLFGSSSAPTNSSTGPFVYGQPTTAGSGSLFGSANEPTFTFRFSGQESRATVASPSAAPASVTPFVFGASAPSATAAPPSFNFTATNTSNVAGANFTPFTFGVGEAAPAFGQSASQTNTPTFGYSASPSLFPAISQTAPTFGTWTNDVQYPPVFGQPSTQLAFGSNMAPSGDSGFQFGNQNLNFSSGNTPGVSVFGPNFGATHAQPANTRFMFNRFPTFHMRVKRRTMARLPVSNRKIKIARRRNKH